MKIFQIVDGKAHWHTPYKSLDELYVDVPQDGGKIERQRRYPESDLFVEAPDEAQEGWIYLGDGKFRSDEPERLQEEIEAIDGQLRDMYKESLFQDWLAAHIAMCGGDAAAFSEAFDFMEFDFGAAKEEDEENKPFTSPVFELVKAKNELMRRLKELEPEIVSL